MRRLDVRRWLAIVNPGAGLPDAAMRCAEALERDGIVIGSVVSRGPGDASRIANEAKDVDGIVAVGGDGTVFEILAGLDRTAHMLAVCPVGHGNCLARDLGVASLSRARLALLHGAARPIDLMDVRLRDATGSDVRHLGACTLAVGYVTEAMTTGRFRLAWLGRAAYAVSSVVTVPRRLRATLTLDGNGVDVPDCTGLAVNNTAHLANFRAFPSARLDDARLDIMGSATGWVGQMAHNACILMGSSLVQAAVTAQTTSAAIELETPSTVMLDGELFREIVSVAVTVAPGVLRCVGAAA